MLRSFFLANGIPTKLFRLTFALSAVAFVGLLTVKNDIIWIVVSIPFVLLALFLLSFRSRFLDDLFFKRSIFRVVLCVILSIFAADYYSSTFRIRLFNTAEKIGNADISTMICRYGTLISYIVGVLSVLALFVYLYWFFSWLTALLSRLFRTFSSFDRWFLICSTICTLILILIVYSQTTLFHEANATAVDGSNRVDILYTSDTSTLIGQNVFLNISARENDIRQPLFGVFTAPFALIAGLCSALLHLPIVYYVLLQFLQTVLLFLSFVAVSKMLHLERLEKALFLTTSIVLFPTMLFILNIEQYIIPVFWLILLIWQSVFSDSGSRRATWIAASGSMLTSGLFLFISSCSEKRRNRLKDYTLSIGIFILVLLIFGRVPMVLSSSASVRSLLDFSGAKLPFFERLMQYISFVSSCFIAPLSVIKQYSAEKIVYHQAEITQWSISGFILLAAALAGFLANRKSIYLKICFLWVVFSFLLLCLFGWGTAENGLVLYTLYFYWAYVSLVISFIHRLFARNHWIRYSILLSGFVALLIINGSELVRIIRFGCMYYPLR